MKKIGLTGGIGSGKTTISKLFKELGVPVFNSDLCARESEGNKYIQDGYNDILGFKVFGNGEIDRPFLRSIIFNDKEKLAKITILVGDYIRKKFDTFAKEHSESQYILFESAILFETGHYTKFDDIICVTADEDIRVGRAMLRDNSTVTEVKDKIKNQLPEDEKILKSKYVIYNNGTDLLDSIDELTEKVLELHKILKNEQANSKK